MFVFTESVHGVDWGFLQVKVDVFGHSERLALPILSPRNQTKETHDHVNKKSSVIEFHKKEN